MAWVWAKYKICDPVTPVDGTDIIKILCRNVILS